MKQRSPLLILLPVLVLSLSACVGASKKAHEMAEQAMYQPIAYANAATPGPCVAVLPGKVASRSYAFRQVVGMGNIRDFAEIEFSKANFPVIESADKHALFQEISLAANLGDAQALQAFSAKDMSAAKFAAVFEVTKAEPVSWETQGGNGEALGALIELGFLIANKGKSNAVGSAIGKTVASVKHYETASTWDVRLRYRVMDLATGEVLAEKELAEKQTATVELNGVLGVEQQDAQHLSLGTVVQRLVQRAVAEIDKEAKEKMVALASAQTKPAKPLSPAKMKKLEAEYAAKVADWHTQRENEAAMEALRLWNFAYENADVQTMALLTDPEAHSFLQEHFKSFGLLGSQKNWRDRFTIQVLNYDSFVVYHDDRECLVKETFQVKFGEKGKESVSDSQSIELLKKIDGQWKRASLTVEYVESDKPRKERINVPAPNAQVFDGFKICKIDLVKLVSQSSDAKTALEEMGKTALESSQDIYREKAFKKFARKLNAALGAYAAREGYDVIVDASRFTHEIPRMDASVTPYSAKGKGAKFLEIAETKEGRLFLYGDKDVPDKTSEVQSGLEAANP